MQIRFLGTSHAARHLALAAMVKGFSICDLPDADLVFVSEDTPTNERGERDLDTIRGLVDEARKASVPIVLTSAVPPGFCRSLGFDIWHQAETLRMQDAAERAVRPEMLIVGSRNGDEPLPDCYQEYLWRFNAPILRMKWEEAEFTKVAINCILASQVDTTNDLAKAAERIGASWDKVSEALRLDKRIGQYSYLKPGRWQDSRHLLRDMKTLRDIA